MTIELFLLYGAYAGFVIGVVVPGKRLGCIVLLAVPVAAIVYVGQWQAAHPENIRSTSGLDFLFGALWPSLGAIAGFLGGVMLCSALTRK